MQYTPDQQRRRLVKHLSQKRSSLDAAQVAVRQDRNARTQRNVENARKSLDRAEKMLADHKNEFPDIIDSPTS